MSIWIHCDFCDAQTPGIPFYDGSVEAEDAGWTNRGTFDRCPKCSTEARP